MEQPVAREINHSKKRLSLTVFFIFAAILIILCGLIYLLNYGIAYTESPDGWIPPRLAIVFYYFILAVVAVCVAVIMKGIYKKRIALWPLLISALILPVLCYHVNYHTLKKDGVLYPLVDEGGIFHFITIGDFNFDGINDETYKIEHTRRTVSVSYGTDGHVDIDSVRGEITGVGYLGNAFLSIGQSNHPYYDYDFKFSYPNDGITTIEQVIINVKFYDTVKAQNTTVTLRDAPQITLSQTLLNKNILQVTLNQEQLEHFVGDSNESVLFFVLEP